MTHYDEIAQARFTVEGTSSYPDATFTLRLSYGTVAGYTQRQGGAAVDDDRRPLRARDRSRRRSICRSAGSRRKATLNPKQPFNFVTTNDIIGGNSGSPMINSRAKWSARSSTATSSRSAAISATTRRPIAPSRSLSAFFEALGKVYDAGGLADELAK